LSYEMLAGGVLMRLWERNT